MNNVARSFSGLSLLLALASCRAFDSDAALVRADTYFEAGDYAAAAAGYTRVLREDAENVRALNNRGVARLRTGDTAGAVADFDSAIALRPSFAEAFYNRGLARFQSGDVAGAIADYGEAIRHSPRYGKAWAGRGFARAKQGDLDGAATDFKTALDVAPPDWADRKAVESELARVEKQRSGK